MEGHFNKRLFSLVHDDKCLCGLKKENFESCRNKSFPTEIQQRQVINEAKKEFEQIAFVYIPSELNHNDRFFVDEILAKLETRNSKIWQWFYKWFGDSS